MVMHEWVCHDTKVSEEGTDTKLLFSIGDRYFVASQVIAFDHGDYETMIFPASEDGEILSYYDLYAFRGHELVSKSIENFINERRYEHDEHYRYLLERSEDTMG